MKKETLANIESSKKQKGLLYKETKKCGLKGLSKKASGYGSIFKGTKKIVKKTKKPNLGEQITGKGPIDVDKIKTYFKVGAGLTTAGGLAYVANS